MEARQSGVEPHAGDPNMFKPEQHTDSNEGHDSLSHPFQPYSALPDELLYRPYQLLELNEEGSDDDDEINVRDIPKLTRTARDSHKGTGNTTGRPSLVAASATLDFPMKKHITPSAGCHGPSEPTGLNPGDVSARGMVFVPFKLIKRYPFSYVGKSNQDQVSCFIPTTFSFYPNALLGAGLLQRESSSEPRLGFVSGSLPPPTLKNFVPTLRWMMTGVYLFDTNHSFFILDPVGSKDPLLLVPTIQFQQFLNLTSNKLGRNIVIPQGQAREKFFLTFGSFNTPLPRFLGHVDSAEAYEGLRGMWFGFPPDDLSILPAGAVQAFQDTMASIYASCRRPSTKNPQFERMKRIERQKQFGRVTKRVQRYLGFRARAVYASHSGKRCVSATLNPQI